MSLTEAQAAAATEALLSLRRLAHNAIEAAKARLAPRPACCCTDAAAVLVVMANVHGTLLTGARPAKMAELEPLVAARSTVAWAALRQGPGPGRVLVVVVNGDAFVALFSEPLAPDQTPAPNAPGGVS